MSETTIMEFVDTNDPKAVRNKNNLLDCYDMVINNKQPMAAMKYVTENYIHHNPLLADGAKGRCLRLLSGCFLTQVGSALPAA